MFDDLLSKSITANEIWSDFEKKHSKSAGNFRKFFHLRPCGSYVTIVTTHRDFPMRGVQCAITKLPHAIHVIADAINGSSVDWPQIALAGEKWNFDKRTVESKAKKNEREFKAQAEIINSINDGKYNFSFVASELIIHEGRIGKRERIDIVAQDDAGTIIFIEVKADGSKDDSKAQALRYIKKYSEDEGFERLLERLLVNYPIYTAKHITGYLGKTTLGTEIRDL